LLQQWLPPAWHARFQSWLAAQMSEPQTGR
jgi:hypothetical protein